MRADLEFILDLLMIAGAFWLFGLETLAKIMLWVSIFWFASITINAIVSPSCEEEGEE